MSRSSIGVGLLLAAAAIAHAGAALADDLVWLKNGGRLRGQVVSEDPKEGVKIKLADGRTRTIPAAEINKVEYDDGGAAAPAAPSAPPPPPAPPAPPPPAPPKVGSVVIDSDEPGQVWLDGEEVGKVPFRREKVPVGTHEVRVEFTAGGWASGTVSVEDGAAASLRLSPSADELAFRPRRGVSFGMAMEAVFIAPAPTQDGSFGGGGKVQALYGGGRLSLFANVGVGPVADVRFGVFGTGAGGSYGAKLFPVGGFFSVALHASRAVLTVGMQGGYSPGDEIHAYSGYPPSSDGTNEFAGMGSIATLGGHFGVGVALGADRRWELGVRQEFAGVLATGYGDYLVDHRSPGWVSTTSVGLTVLFFGRGRAPATSTTEATP